MAIVEQTYRGADCACKGTRVGNGVARVRSVSARLERDHREIDAILNDVGSLARAGDFTAAQNTFANFRRRLDGHIDAEEEILFPVYEQLSTCDAPTHVLLGEHADIRRLMAIVAAALQKQDILEPIQAVLNLTRLLNTHNAEEERVLYPDTDAALELDMEREALVARIDEHLERAVDTR
jgi:hemerythrin superfamily protein